MNHRVRREYFLPSGKKQAERSRRLFVSLRYAKDVEHVAKEMNVMAEEKAKHGSSDIEEILRGSLSESASPLEVAQWIKESVEEGKFGSDTITVAMDLPSGSRIGSGNLLKALEMVLREYFITIPDEVASKIAGGDMNLFSFVAPAKERHLKPRQVEINTMPGISTLTIKGVEPVDGDDGFIKLFFDFRVQPGRLLPDGSMDFREVNRFPQASKDQLVVRVYEPSSGTEGTDVMGLPIRAKAGKPAPLKIKDGFYSKDDMDPETSRRFFDYFAKKSGIIICTFEGSACDENLRKISIQNQIKVRDIDFNTGNFKGASNELRCKADLVVEGDIRGCFAVVIDGSLTVQGAVEGETVDATGPVVVNFARNFVRSGSDMEVGSARKATLIAKKRLKIKKELSEGAIKADILEIQPEGSNEILLGKSSIEANQIFASSVNIRNIVEIEMGKGLFQLYSQLKAQERDLSEEIERKKEALKNRGAVFGQKMKLAQAVLNEQDQGLVPVLKQFATMILLGSLSVEKLKTRMDGLIDKLPFDLHLLTKQLRLMLDIQEELSGLNEKMKILEEQIAKTEKAIDSLQVEMTGRMTDSGQIILKCNGYEKRILPIEVQGKTFRLLMKYDPQKGPIITVEAL